MPCAPTDEGVGYCPNLIPSALYIGTAVQYQTYQTIARQQQQANQQWQPQGGVEEAREWEEENGGMGQ